MTSNRLSPELVVGLVSFLTRLQQHDVEQVGEMDKDNLTSEISLLTQHDPVAMVSVEGLLSSGVPKPRVLQGGETIYSRRWQDGFRTSGR